MKILSLSFGLLLSIRIQAATSPKDFYLQALLQVRATKELQQLERRHAKLQNIQAKCDEELKLRKLPAACYEVLEVELALRRLSLGTRNALLENLDVLCENYGSHERRLSRLQQLSKASYLSSGCRKTVERLLEDRRYKKASSDIEEGFRLRHKVGAIFE